MKQFISYALLLCTSAVLFSACGNDEEDQLNEDKAAIEDYLNENGLTAEQTDEGLYYTLISEGDNCKPGAQSIVKLNLEGYYLDGVTFAEGDSILADMSFILEGFRIGLPQFGIGGKGTFYIPSSLGYGSTAPVGVRPDAVLIYDFELIDVDYKIEKPYRDSLESTLIENYLMANELTSFVTTEGIHIVFENEGSEEKPTVNSTVTVDYRGTLLNGDIFDSSYERGTPSTFSLQNVIEGWKIGIPYFGRGGKGKLIIPYRYAYGINGSNNIPPFSALIFDIEVYDF